jgi:hypothetical protein
VRPFRVLSLSALALGSLCFTAPLAAQSSMFGVNGLGLPGRPLTPRTLATGGSFGLFDAESDLNPAALAELKSVAAGLVSATAWRDWEAPAGTASLRGSRYPLFFIAGPLPKTRLGLGLSAGSYADRDFALASSDTIQLRGVPVTTHDTLAALGGLSEVRFGFGLSMSRRNSLGAAIYWITGSSRMSAHRVFSDTTIAPSRQSGELSYQGLGMSLGLTHRFSDQLRMAVLVRSDGEANVRLDGRHAYYVDLPYTFSVGVQARSSRRLTIGVAGSFRTWSGANSDLVEQGGVGAINTLELAAGAELARSARHPGTLPIRFGVRYADLPFPIVTGQRPKEFSLSAGTGGLFAQDRAGIDISAEYAWRSEGSPYKEQALTIVFGLSIRPYGPGQR